MNKALVLVEMMLYFMKGCVIAGCLENVLVFRGCHFSRLLIQKHLLFALIALF